MKRLLNNDKIYLENLIELIFEKENELHNKKVFECVSNTNTFCNVERQ